MSRKLGFWLLWVSILGYAFLLAPPDQPDTIELITNLSTNKWEGINPLIIALFNIMGIWPLIYSGLMFIDGRQQKLPAWLFATASFGVGAFALLPYSLPAIRLGKVERGNDESTISLSGEALGH